MPFVPSRYFSPDYAGRVGVCVHICLVVLTWSMIAYPAHGGGTRGGEPASSVRQATPVCTGGGRCDASAATVRHTTAGGWHLHTTDHFVTYTTDAALGRRLALRCESLRSSLSKQWLGDDKADEADAPAVAWAKCRCLVVVHPNAAGYANAVGRAGEQSSGCSTIRVNREKIVYRRIDLRADRGDPLTAALPHEMTHVVLADRFLNRPLPRWADEGMAILADPAHKQQGHDRDAQMALARGATFRANELLQLVDYPPSTRQTVFYGQSASLVRFLVGRGGAATFVDFVDRSMRDGADNALRATYDIASAAELDRQWRRSATELLVAGQLP